MTLPIKGASLGNPDDATDIAIRRGALKPAELRRYAIALWVRCAELGIRADAAFAQADLETGTFTSTRWTREGNPAGLGITTGMPDSTVQRTLTPEEWADIHAIHLGGYAGIDPGPTLRALDFRWQAMVDRGWFGVAKTMQDLDERWAEDGPQQYGDVIESRWRNYNFPSQERWTPPAGDGTGGNEGRPPMALTFGRVPMPGYVDLQHTTASKPEGVGWDNLGKRDVLGIVLHRMWGTLLGTDSHFANPSVGSLTDYGIGTANIDGAALDGVIHKYNDPLGYRSGWASGRVSAPYGDGKLFVDKYGVNAVNKRLVSIETSGYDTEPFTDVAWGELVKLIAYYADQCKVPYTSLPLNPHTGINFIIWHEEITFGTGKKCPFAWMKQNTPRLYRDVAAYLQPYQEVGVIEPDPQPQPEPEPEPIPAPQYAPPAPIEELVPVADANRNTIAAITTAEATDFVFVGDRVEAIRETPRLQRANAGARRTGPDIAAGEQFEVDFMFTAKNGKRYYLTPYYTRVRVEDTKRVRD